MLKKPSGYKSSFISVAGLSVPVLAFVVATPYAIASFGNDYFGLLLLLVSLQALMLSIDFGVSAGAVVLITRHATKGDYAAASRVLSEVAIFFLLVGVLIVGATYLITAYMGQERLLEFDADYVVSLVRLMSVGVLIGLLSNALSLFLRALEQIPYLVLVQNVYATGLWCGVLFIAVSGGDLTDIIFFGIILYAIQLLLYLMWLIRCPVYSFHPIMPTGSHLKGISSYSGFAFISQLSSMITYHIDRVLIGILSSVSQVSYYAVPANIVSRLLNVGALFNSFVFPRAVNLHTAGNMEGLRALYIKASRYTFLLLVPVLVPLVVFAPDLLAFWLGEEFSENSQLTARVLLIAFFIASVSITPSQIYNGMGNSRIGAIYSLIGSVINVVLCLVLIPKFGSAGAAFASLAAMLQAIFYRRSLERELGIDRKKQGAFHRTISLIALSQVAICWLLHRFVNISDIYSMVLVLASVWCAFYLFWLLLPARFSSQERELFRKVIARVGL